MQLGVVWACAMHLGLPQRILHVHCRYFQHQRRVLFEGCVADPLQTITAILPDPTWSVFLSGMVMQDAMSEVWMVDPQVKLKVFVDDISFMLNSKV